MSPAIHHIEGLDIDQNLDFQRKAWKVQRITWAVMLAILLAVGLGFLGAAGPANYRTSSNNSVKVGFQSFVHRIAPTDIHVTLSQLSGDSTQLLISRDFMGNYQVQSIVPQPDSVDGSSDMLVYHFNVAPGATSMNVDFSLLSDRAAFGTIKGSFGPDRADLITIKQVVYP